MIIDASALLSVIYAESDARFYSDAISLAMTRRVSAATWLEALISVHRKGGEVGVVELESLREKAALELLPYTPDHVIAAFEAHRRFGKGNHPARLNFGDCIAFATAQLAREPLLFKGDDFAHPDVEAAMKAFGGGVHS